MSIRVRRQRRAAPEEPKARIKRSRAAPAARVVRQRRVPAEQGGRTYFIVDWAWSLEMKFKVYLMTSFLYYHMNRSLIRDHQYDQICKELLEGWDSWQHQHKHLVSKADLQAGTGYSIKYPRVVIGAANIMLARHLEY